MNLDDKLSDEDDMSGSLEIHWDGESRQCASESDFLVIGVCDVFAETGSVGPYTTDLEFRVTFALAWDLDDNGQIRTP